MRISVVAAAALLLSASPAAAGDWRAAGAANGHGETLRYDLGQGRGYVFECAPDAVVVTNTGITDLVDVRSNQKIGDAPGSTITPDAAVMAMFTGKGQPEFQPAEAAANPVKGWDFTQRLAKKDKRLDAFARSDMISLFTTGFTAIATIDNADRKLVAGFVARCRA